MRVTPFTILGDTFFVISHQNITERKMAEEAPNLSRIDGLTDIPNRRYFNEFLDSEWKRCHRLGMPVSLVIIDLDNFQLLNDTCGHPEGDELVYSVKEKGRNQASISLISDKTNGQTQHSHQRALGLEI